MSTEIVTNHFEFVNATPDFIMSVLFPAGHTYSTYHKGSVVPTTPITVTISWETVLSAVRKILDATGGEYDIVESTNTINIYASMGAANMVNVRTRKNLKGLEIKRYSKNIINELYGAGGGVTPSTIAGARHLVTYVNGATIRTTANLVAEDDSWNTNFKLKFVTGAAITEAIAISDCSHTAAYDEFTLASPPVAAPAIGDKVVITDTSGNEINYIRAAASIASYGELKGIYKNPAYLDSVNLIEKPCLDGTYTASLCEKWTKAGSPTLAENTDAAYIRYGTKSQHVTGVSDNDGVYQTITTVAAQYYSIQAYVYIVSGTVKIRLVSGANTYEVTEDATGWQTISIPVTQINGTSVDIKILQSGAPVAEFYLDGVQATQTESERDFTDNSDPTTLWAETYTELIKLKDPVVEYRCNFADLNKMFPRDYPFDKISLGDTVLVYDSEMGVSGLSLRVEEMNYSPFSPESVEHVVTNA
jgi:hypothetical protein